MFGQIVLNLGACHSPWLSSARCGSPATSCFTTRPLEQGQCRAGHTKTFHPHTWSGCLSPVGLGALNGQDVCVCAAEGVAKGDIKNLENELACPSYFKVDLDLLGPLRPGWIGPSSCPHPDCPALPCLGLSGLSPWPPDWFPPSPFSATF